MKKKVERKLTKKKRIKIAKKNEEESKWKKKK